MPVPNALAHQAQLRHALLRAGVQPRLTIGAVNDPLEREADAAAERVMRMPEFPSPASGRGARGEETLIQTKPAAATSHASPQLESSLNSLNSGGTPLDTANRAFFEPRFGQDFSRVRLHTDDNAARMADALNAKAFTLGNDIAFAANQYSGNTSACKNLLGHELAHVVQTKLVQRQSNDREEEISPSVLSSNIPVEEDPTEDMRHYTGADNSSALQENIEKLKAEGWKFIYGEKYETNKNTKIVTINISAKDDRSRLAEELSRAVNDVDKPKITGEFFLPNIQIGSDNWRLTLDVGLSAVNLSYARHHRWIDLGYQYGKDIKFSLMTSTAGASLAVNPGTGKVTAELRWNPSNRLTITGSVDSSGVVTTSFAYRLLSQPHKNSLSPLDKPPTVGNILIPQVRSTPGGGLQSQSTEEAIHAGARSALLMLSKTPGIACNLEKLSPSISGHSSVPDGEVESDITKIKNSVNAINAIANQKRNIFDLQTRLDVTVDPTFGPYAIFNLIIVW
jgi:hypothetical protein